MKILTLRFVPVLALLTTLGAELAYGDLLVGSWTTDSVRRYDDSGTYVDDFVSPGEGGLDLPDGMAYGADGHLYVASSNSNQVLRYHGKTGEFIDAFVNEGLSGPGNLQFGPDGFLYVCNKNTGEVLRFDPIDGSLESVFASDGGLTNPVGLMWKDGLLYVSDFAGGAIRRYDEKTGAFFDIFTVVASPLILNQDANGNVLVSSHGASNILQFDCDGNPLGGFLVDGPVACPVGHLFDGSGEMWIASWGNHRLLRYNANNGEFIADFSIDSALFRPNDLLRYTPPLTGDVNKDGVVDLLDVSPFVDLLGVGGFQIEADINCDDVVDLLDVAPLVDLLAG